MDHQLVKIRRVVQVIMRYHHSFPAWVLHLTMKLGLVGLAKTLAIEGGPKNIFVNAVAPTAGSRLTATALPQEVVDVLKPEYVTPTVVYLSHEESTVNGRLFEVGGG